MSGRVDCRGLMKSLIVECGEEDGEHGEGMPSFLGRVFAKQQAIFADE